MGPTPQSDTVVGLALSLIDQLTTAVILSDARGQILDLNPAACAFLQKGHGRGLLLSNLLPFEPDWPSLLQRAQTRALMVRDAILGTERADIALRALEQERFLIEIHAATRARQIMLSEALQAQAEQNQLLLRNLAHEIRNPLASIKGAAQRAQSQEHPARYLELIIAQSERLNGLLHSLASPRPQRRPDNIHRALEAALNAFAAAPENAGLTLIRHYDPSIPAFAFDADQMQQIFFNLLSNAAKACQCVGSITLTSEIVHQYTIDGHCHRQVVAVRITDEGRGIPESQQTSIFQPMVGHFPEGSGLGLAIVQNLVRGHGGAIELQSRPGRTTFSIILPTT